MVFDRGSLNVLCEVPNCSFGLFARKIFFLGTAALGSVKDQKLRSNLCLEVKLIILPDQIILLFIIIFLK